MPLLAPEHVAAVAVTLIAGAAAVWAARRHGGDRLVRASRALGVLIAGTYVTEVAAYAVRGDWSVRLNLPLHLTDVATIVAVLALLRPRPFLVELTYFWGLSASLQAVITPELGRGFPDPYFLTYFVIHGGVVVAAVLLVFGRGFTPRRGAVARVYLATVAVAAAAGVGSLATGGNYMYLRRKPARGSLLDLLGPWPLYIAAGALLGLALFLLLDAPFRRARGRGRSAAAN